jgi:hypothetical protein
MALYRKPLRSIAQIMHEHGHPWPPKRPEPPPMPGATDKNGPITDELRNSRLVAACRSQDFA